MMMQDDEQDLPTNIEDTDRVNLGTVIATSREFRLLNKMVKSFEQETGTKVRKVNKNQAKLLWQLISSNKY